MNKKVNPKIKKKVKREIHTRKVEEKQMVEIRLNMLIVTVKLNRVNLTVNNQIECLRKSNSLLFIRHTQCIDTEKRKVK